MSSVFFAGRAVWKVNEDGTKTFVMGDGIPVPELSVLDAVYGGNGRGPTPHMHEDLGPAEAEPGKKRAPVKPDKIFEKKFGKVWFTEEGVKFIRDMRVRGVYPANIADAIGLKGKKGALKVSCRLSELAKTDAQLKQVLHTHKGG